MSFADYKFFIRQFGHLIRYTNDDLLYWYFSYPKAPTEDQISAEIDRRLAERGPELNKLGRKNFRRNCRKALKSQLGSIAERYEILCANRKLGLSDRDSLAVTGLRLPIIRELREMNLGVPSTEIWMSVGSVR